jgi:hypothetical protein
MDFRGKSGAGALGVVWTAVPLESPSLPVFEELSFADLRSRGGEQRSY